MEGASVRGPEGMRIHQYHSWRFTVKTGPDGRFRAESAAREVREDYRDDLLSHVEAAGFLEGSLAGRPEDWQVLGEGGRIEGLRVVLRRAASVVGTVLDVGGAPSKRALVEYGTGPLGGEVRTWLRHQWADGNGRYRIEGLDPLADVRIRASNWGAASGELCLAGLLHGGEAATADLKLGEPSGERAWLDGFWHIRGTVVDPDGRPVAGARVNGPAFGRAPGEGYDAVTGDDGRFEGVLAATEREDDSGRQLTVRHEGLACLHYRLRDDEWARLERKKEIDGLVLRLRPGTVVRGRVLDPEGKPVARAGVSVTDRACGDRRPTWILRVRADDAGEFRIRGIDPEGNWFLLADREERVSHYIPLAGRFGAGAEVVVDIPLPHHRELPVEVLVRGWKKGMSLSPDSVGAPLDGAAWTGSMLPGPHRFTLLDAAEHPVAHAETDIPYEASSWRIEMEAGPCEECARAEKVAGE